MKSLITGLALMLAAPSVSMAAEWHCFTARGGLSTGEQMFSPVQIFLSGHSVIGYQVIPLNEKVDDLLHGFNGKSICLKGYWLSP